MNLVEAQQRLNDNGFPCGTADGIYGPNTRYGLQHFQLATTGGPVHAAGGWDSDTARAIEWLPNLSPNFKTTEFKSSGNGHCYVRKELLYALEAFREIVGKPLPIASGYRDPAYNGRIPGAATNSLHLYGLAADIHSTRVGATLAEVTAMKLFSGIGWNRSTGFVSHVDVRHLTGRHTNTPTNPSVWRYNR